MSRGPGICASLGENPHVQFVVTINEEVLSFAESDRVWIEFSAEIRGHKGIAP